MKRPNSSLGIVFVLTAAVCAGSLPASERDPACAGLEQKVAALTARIATLERQLAARAASAPAPVRAPKAAPRTAKPKANYKKKSDIDPIYGQIDNLLAAGDIAAAQKVFADRKATGEKSAVINTLNREMTVVGEPVPDPWAIEKWFQGSADLDGSGTKLLVFWEEWCPYCKKELPRFQQLYEEYRGRGLQVVGLTRLTRTSTEAGVLGLIAEKKVGFPVAKETGAVAEYFHVKGIPAAAVVRDGKIIWRGHPLRLTDEMLQGWL